MSTLNIEDVQPKMGLSGVVKKLELTGAVLDVGLPYDALLLNANMQKRSGARQTMKIGDTVEVWVLNVDAQREFISVTTNKPAQVDWNEIKVGDVFKGRVARTKPFGVFVDIGAERPGLVHISELAHDYVKTPEDLVNRGDEIDVKVIGIDLEKGQIDLSVKALSEPKSNKPEQSAIEEVLEDPQDEMATAMALAFEKAHGTDSRNVPQKNTKKRVVNTREIDNIIKRTLKGHAD